MGQGGIKEHYRNEYRTLGHGVLAKPYERAVRGAGAPDVPFEQQPRYEIAYKGHPVGTFVPDIVAYGLIVVDTEVVDQLGDTEPGQMLNYMGITGLETGLSLSFERPRLQWRQVRT